MTISELANIAQPGPRGRGRGRPRVNRRLTPLSLREAHLQTLQRQADAIVELANLKRETLQQKRELYITLKNNSDRITQEQIETQVQLRRTEELKQEVLARSLRSEGTSSRHRQEPPHTP